MSKNYSFEIAFDLDYSKKNILSVLENGSKIGCIYKDYGPDFSQYNTLNTNAAADFIWSQYLKSNEYGPLIHAKYNKTNFAIWFYNKNDKLELCIDPDHIAWKKRYDISAWYGINFYRYQKFMLHLIGNNVITYFETYEWFSQPYDAKNIEHNKKIYIKFYTYWAYDIYHHLKINGRMQHITWLDSNKQPIDIKSEDNTFENIIYNEDASQCWYGIYRDIILKFSYIKDRTFIIEPMMAHVTTSASALGQAQIFDKGLRNTIELFKNMPVLRLITFEYDKDIENINKMDE